MNGLLVLLPCASVALAIFALRLSVVPAAAIALATGAALWALGVFSPALLAHMSRAVSDALILEMLVGVIIFTGLLFIEVVRRGGGLEALGGVIGVLRLAPSRTTILVSLGVGVTLESLTGYGVSMLVTIPLLLGFVSRSRAIFIGLIGMSLMTWGALSVAALLGAALASMSAPMLAKAIVLTSGPVAALLPFFCLQWSKALKFKELTYAALTGAALVAGIASTSYWIGVEVAGVGGGLAVILLSIFCASSRRGLGKALGAPAMLPFYFLIIGIVAQKLAVPHLADANAAITIETDRVSFRILESPGIALLTVSLLAVAMQPAKVFGADQSPLMRQVISRSWRALSSIFLFLVTARLLAEIGGISALAETLAQLGPYPAIAMITLLGGVGAFITGSGVTSNALFMPSAAAAGASFDALPLFAALQHSGGAHFAIASLPMIAILLAALPNREPGDEKVAMRHALGLAAIWMFTVIASGGLQFASYR